MENRPRQTVTLNRLISRIAPSMNLTRYAVSVYNQIMQFIWDENKRQANLTKHGFDFADASQVFAGATLTFEDSRFAYGEQRFITSGLLQGRIIVIAHTESQDAVRIISMREGTKREQIIFFKNLSD